MKAQRWYELSEDGKTAYVYCHPYPDKAMSVSIIPKEGLTFYRNNFSLSKCWNKGLS